MTGLDHGHESEMLRRFVVGSEWLHAAPSHMELTSASPIRGVASLRPRFCATRNIRDLRTWPIERLGEPLPSAVTERRAGRMGSAAAFVPPTGPPYLSEAASGVEAQCGCSVAELVVILGAGASRACTPQGG
jgi:hypothetical protein